MKIPAVTGQSEVTISKIGRKEYNSLWVIPEIGDQIIVSADDELMTNVFWIHSDAVSDAARYRNYFEAFDTRDVAAQVNGSGVGIAQAISYNNVVFSEGITLVDGSKMKFSYEGTYNLQYSIQWKNTDSQAHDTVVWIGYNGSPYPNSSTHISVPSRHGSVDGTAVTAINFVGKAYENDYIQLYWAGNNTAISMETFPVGAVATLPATAPAAPSVIVTVTQVA